MAQNHEVTLGQTLNHSCVELCRPNSVKYRIIVKQ
jgi:hypothetical protein